jgi:hypothetical protein
MSPWALCAFLAVAPEGAAGAPDLDEFLARARAASTRYDDRAVAVAEGYRLIGRDFPAMGEHWIHVGNVFDGEVDADHPDFLSYAEVDGRPRLLGVAYALALLPGERPPSGPIPPAAWHGHVRSVDEETLAPRHGSAAGGHAGHHGNPNPVAHAPSLFMAHAWLRLPNPAGMFAPDNWAIPYLRLGLAPPPEASEDSGKALSLLVGGAAVVSAGVRRAGALDAADADRIAAALRRASEDVGRMVPAARALDAADAARLAARWAALWREIDAITGENAAVARLGLR